MKFILLARITVPLVFIATLGCGDGPKTSRVSGAVSHKNKPISYGQIVFVGPGGVEGAGAIEDGKYTVVSAPRGDVKIVVKAFAKGGQIVNPTETPDAKAVGPVGKGPVDRIPAEYGDAATTKLTYTVTGDATHDIALP